MRDRECRILFLRLPDGKRNGAGFARYGFQSLRSCARKKSSHNCCRQERDIPGWSDLTATISSLISADSATEHRRPHDRSEQKGQSHDHSITGSPASSYMISANATVDCEYYVGYALGTRAANRATGQAREKTAIFRGLRQEMISP